uniref:RxLR effector candidate protein n=1 Tax=Hyaloperonospora arabidopsidis (strain Emoy2) TaxID=559515 RepID=M4BVN4_HYAAE
MWSCNDFSAVVTAAAVVVAHVATARSSSSISGAICYDVTECYVDGSPSKMCDRTGKGCHPCLSDRESDSLFSMLHLRAEYNCFAVRNDGECPRGTTKCATRRRRRRASAKGRRRRRARGKGSEIHVRVGGG